MKKLLFSRFAVPWLLMACAAFYVSSCTDQGGCEGTSDWLNSYTFKVLDTETGKNLFETVLVDNINFQPNIKITDENGNPPKGSQFAINYVEFEPLDTFAVIGKKYLTTYYITLSDGDIDTLTFEYEYIKVCTLIDQLKNFKACYNGKSCDTKRPGNGIVTLKKFK
jgi:hypothetical protein